MYYQQKKKFFNHISYVYSEKGDEANNLRLFVLVIKKRRQEVNLLVCFNNKNKKKKNKYKQERKNKLSNIKT